MNPDAIDGLYFVLIVTVFTTIYCPLLCWLLAEKASTA